MITNQLAPEIPHRGTFMEWFPLRGNRQGGGVEVSSYLEIDVLKENILCHGKT
jgi:hypothetical protein